MVDQLDGDVTGVGDNDLRNEAYVAAIRFVPGERHLTIGFDFVSELPGGRQRISLEFGEVEVLRIEPCLPTGVDPGYGHALLFGIGHWADVDFCAVELTATVS